MKPEARMDMAALSGATRDLVARYTAGWDRALRGGAAPDLEAHLSELSQADRSGVRAVLEEVDRTHRAESEPLRRRTGRSTSRPRRGRPGRTHTRTRT